MLAATPFPHGSGANLAVAGFVVGTLSDQLLPSGHSSQGTRHGRRDSFERVLLSINNHFSGFQFAALLPSLAPLLLLMLADTPWPHGFGATLTNAAPLCEGFERSVASPLQPPRLCAMGRTV